PVQLIQGQFAGRTLRGELREVQQAHIGRKYMTKDRRPLDPPPVAQLRLLCVSSGIFSNREEEI
ncbi:hypothetical protein GLOTRDRAFT_16028, partial [Gloeophyllum trabeum ATCC 11539]